MGDDDGVGAAASDHGIYGFPDLHVLPVIAKFFSAIEADDVSPFVIGVIEAGPASGGDGKSRSPMGASKQRVHYRRDHTKPHSLQC